MSGDIATCARRVYELHWARSRTRTPTWDELPEPRRSALIAAYWRTRASYEVGRREVREVRIELLSPIA